MSRNASEILENSKNHHRQDEINNISAGVFRREYHNPLNINEYFARNLNMPAAGKQAASSTNSSHSSEKMRLGSPASLRQILPIALCLFTFASVLSMLIIYIDTTEIRHQQFRLNMSRDYDLQGISQDNPVLVTYLREVHLRKYAQEPLFNEVVVEESASHSPSNKFNAEMAELVATELLQRKVGGTFIQSSIGAGSDSLMIAPHLIERYQWRGLIVEPDPKKFFGYGKQYGRNRDVYVIHACFSPTGFPKEVTLHQDGEGAEVGGGQEVKISSVLDGEEEDASEWFENRVKCFSLFTLMLAVNETQVDLLSLSLHGLELQILKTLPFERVRIDVISLHFARGEDQRSGYIQTVTRFLTARGFKLMKVVGHNYFYKAKRGLKRMMP